jgi:pimeloyl-ACP methyl ester carboxylesterase
LTTIQPTSPAAAQLYEFGGQGPIIHLAVANGFPPETYRPMLSPLTVNYRAISILPRALWMPPQDPRLFRSWRTTKDDILAGLRASNSSDVILLGHSMGGIASMLAALDEPERFRALIMLDPTVLPPNTLRLAAAVRILGLHGRMPIVTRALRRRSEFSSVDEAFAYWRPKPLFADWPDDALRLYTESATRPASPNGQNPVGIELRWSAAWEAQYFKTLFTASWRVLPRLRRLSLPMLIIRGRETDTFTPATAARVQALLPNIPQVEIAGHGHLFPQSAPLETARIIAEWLGKNAGAF